MVEYYAYSIYHGQAAALGGQDRTHGLAVVLLNNHVPYTRTTTQLESFLHFDRFVSTLYYLLIA